MPAFRTITVTRAAVAALATAMMLSLLPATSLAGVEDAPAAVRQAEWDVLGQINGYRVSRGLTPVRMAQSARLAARERSNDMRNGGYLSHSSPTGKDAASLLAKYGVHYEAGAENIGRISFIDWDSTVVGMMSGWKGSPSHNATILSRNYNYVGIGAASDGKVAYLTTIFLQQKDHTAPKAGMVAASTGFAVAAREDGKRRVTVRWWGRDPKTAVFHSGIKGFTVQHKRVGGKKGWQTIRHGTLKHSLRMTLTKGKHKFRVRAVDNAGNVSKWHRAVLFRVL
jgi:uncharacterized protein YkwD